MELHRRKNQSKSSENLPESDTTTNSMESKVSSLSTATPSTTYFLTRIVFIRLLGLVYAFSFLAAFHQTPVLIGYQGLYPAYLHMQRVKERFGIWMYPSLFYFLPTMDSSDASLRTICAIGTLLGLFLLWTGRCNAILLFILWCFHTSLLNIGQLFYGYGWETQILETTFLAMFLVPFVSLAKMDRSSPPSPLFIFLMRFLITRIMLGAGLIKIRGDQCWRDLTCMEYHYETQPIPNPISYYLHQTPKHFHQFEVLVNHFIELIAPFLCIIPIRPLRHLGGSLQIFFQILLIISGNLSVLNWITMGPALWCFDDSYPLYKYFFRTRSSTEATRSRWKTLRSIVHYSVFALVLYLSIDPVKNLFSSRQRMNSSFDRLNLVNTYGAFGSVGKVRHEVIISGCDRSTVKQCDRDNAWKEYEFICKPGRLDQRPCFSAPYHRRLAWQLWFAAMQDLQHNPWLVHLMIHLLASDQHSPVNVFLSAEGNPFPSFPPKFIKADLYRYQFTRLGHDKSNWWQRDDPHVYSPILSLNSSQTKSFLRQMRWKVPSVPMRY